MKICIVSQQIGKIFSGIGLYTYNLVNQLAACGHSVTLIAPATQRPAANLKYNFIGTGSGYPHNHARWFSQSMFFGMALKNLERHQTFDLIHFTEAREFFFATANAPIVGSIHDSYSARFSPLRYYLHHYNDGWQRWMYYRIVHIFEAQGYSRLQALIANSEFTRNEIKTSYPRITSRVEIVNYGINLNRFEKVFKLRQDLIKNNKVGRGYQILFIGGNMQRKGLPALIQSAPLILKHAPETKFWIVGKDPAIPYLKSLCIKRGVAENFEFFGLLDQDHLMELYARATVFAMPSLTEAFGIVFLEALASGTPIVATSVGGIPEIIRDGENGRLVNPDDPGALANALVELLQDGKLQARFREAGFQSVQRFSVESMVNDTLNVYKSVLN